MDRVDLDNGFFSTMFFPAYTSPKRPIHPLHKNFYMRLIGAHPWLGILVQVLLVYVLYRVIKRIALCLAPGLFDGFCLFDTLRNLFQCGGGSGQGCPVVTRCPHRQCPF